MASSSLSSSSAVSPDSKKMPGIATGTVRLSTSMVAVAHCSGVAFGPSGVGPRGGSFSSALLVPLPGPADSIARTPGPAVIHLIYLSLCMWRILSGP